MYKFQQYTQHSFSVRNPEKRIWGAGDEYERTYLTNSAETRSRHCPHSMCSRVYVTLSVCPCCRFAAVGPVARRCRPIAAWAELSSSGVGMRAVQRCQRTYEADWRRIQSLADWFTDSLSRDWCVCCIVVGWSAVQHRLLTSHFGQYIRHTHTPV